MTYKIKKNHIDIWIHYTKKDLLYSCGDGQWIKDKHCWRAGLGVDFLRNFISTFNLQDEKLNEILNKAIITKRKELAVLRECSMFVTNSDLKIPIEIKPKLTSYRHQDISLYASLNIAKFGLFLEAGTGKSKIIIDNIITRHLKGLVRRVLIVCPVLNIYNTWVDQLDTHNTIKASLDYTVLYGDKKKKLKIIEDINTRKDCLVLTNYDTISNYGNLLNKFDFIVFDESRNLGSSLTNRTIACNKLAIDADYIILASGTVSTLKDCEDVFSQFITLDCGATFGLSYARFREKYFIDEGETYPDWKLKDDSLDLVRTKMYSKAISFKKSACLDLPNRVVKTIKIPMTKEQKDFTNWYCGIISKEDSDSIRVKLPNNITDFIDVVTEKQAIFKAEPIASRVKLLEICASGYYKPFSKPDVIIPIKSDKLNYLVDILNEIGTDKKIILWVSYNYDIAVISERLDREKIGYYVFTSKGKDIDNWRVSKDKNVLIGNVAIGSGVTLNEATYMIHYTLPNSLNNYLQSIDRNYRIGQNNKVTIFTLFTEDSYDETVYKSLKGTLKISSKLTNSNIVKEALGKLI